MKTKLASVIEPNILIFINEETLTDNSTVYNVSFSGNTYAAVTEDDATEFADKIKDAINEHTNEIADVVINY